MTTPRATQTLTAFFVALALTACSTRATDVDATHAEIEVLFAEDRVELVAGTPTIDDQARVDADGTIEWTFADRRGAIVAEGRVRDSRIMSVESFGEHDEMSDATILAGAGTLRALVPNVEGTLSVRTRDGQLFGELQFSPLTDNYSADTSPDGKTDINFETDVIGTPQLVYGTGRGRGKFNILVVPEGYQRNELDQFHTDVATMIESFVQQDVYRDHASQFNVYYQDIQSHESGISDPRANVTKRTAFDITFGNDRTSPRRCIMPSDAWRNESAANMRKFRRDTAADVIVILANINETGGCASRPEHFIVMSREAFAPTGYVLAHELGHSLFKLADEYAGPFSACALGPNLSTSSSDLPWSDLVTPGTPLPTTGTDPNVVGAFEGGGNCNGQVFRPQYSCLMRDNQAQGFCQVCRGLMEQGFERQTSRIRSASITNRSAQKLWLACDFLIEADCGAMRGLEPGATETITLANNTFTVVPSDRSWPSTTVTAPSEAFSIYDNGSDPLSPTGSEPTDIDAGMDIDAGGEIDAGMSVDAGSMETDAGEIDAGEVDAGEITSSCRASDLIINEVQTAGASASDEFVEIWNPCNDVVDLRGVHLVYQSAHYSGSGDSATLASFSGVLGAHEYLVVGGESFSGASSYSFSTGLSQTGGAVGLRDSSGSRVDSVGWGSASNALVEGSPAEAPADDMSIGRVDGYDSNDNSSDLFATYPTPGAQN